MLHTSLRASNDLQYTILAGIQRVAGENIFSNLNSPFVYTAKNREYAEYFGFMKQEVKELPGAYGFVYDDTMRQMYDGCNMGGIGIYNPWSVINHIDRGELTPYWMNTSSNKMIRSATQDREALFRDGYEESIRTETVNTLVNFETSFFEIRETSSL